MNLRWLPAFLVLTVACDVAVSPPPPEITPRKVERVSSIGTGTFFENLFRMAADASGVYWTRDGNLYRVAEGQPPVVLASAGKWMTGFVVDGPTIYFGAGDADSRVGRIGKVATTGGEWTPVAEHFEGRPTSLSVRKGFVYFNTSSEIWRVPVAGGSSENLVPAGQEVYVRRPFHIATDDQNLYWLETQNNTVRLSKMLLDGGAPTVLHESLLDGPMGLLFEHPTDLLVVGNHVYFSINFDFDFDVQHKNDRGRGRILKVPVQGGPTTTFAPYVKGIYDIATDGEFLYWAVPGTHNATTDYPYVIGEGTIQKAPLAGGDPEIIATQQVYPLYVAVTDSALYWLTKYAVFRLSPREE